MPEPTPEERRQRGLDLLKQLTGGDAAAIARDLEAELGPLGSYTIDYAIGDIWSRPGMSPRDRCYVAICMLATLQDYTTLKDHIGYGLNLGLTEETIQEAFVQLAGYAGFPRAVAAQRAADEVLADRTGADQLPPRNPAPALTDDQRRDNAVEMLKIMAKHRRPAASPPAGAPAGGAPAGGGGGADLGSFSRTSGRFGWGEIWARGGITPRERVMAVCASLLVQGKEQELNGHLNHLLNRGGTMADIEEMMVTAAIYAGFPTAVEGFRIFRKVEAERSPEGAGA